MATTVVSKNLLFSANNDRSLTRGSAHTLNMYLNVALGYEMCDDDDEVNKKEEGLFDSSFSSSTTSFGLGDLFSLESESLFAAAPAENEEGSEEEEEEHTASCTYSYRWESAEERLENLFSYRLHLEDDDFEEGEYDSRAATTIPPTTSHQQRHPSAADFPDLLNGDDSVEVVVSEAEKNASDCEEKKPEVDEPEADNITDDSPPLLPYPATYQDLFRQLAEKKEEDALLGTTSSSHTTTSGNVSFDQRPRQVHPLMAEALQEVCVADRWMKVSKRAQMQKLMMEIASALEDKANSKNYTELEAGNGGDGPEKVESLEHLTWVLCGIGRNVYHRLTTAFATKAAEGDSSTNVSSAASSLRYLIDLDSDRKREVLVALHVILLLADSSCFISSLVMRIQDHLEKCRPAQLQAIPLVIKIAGHLLLDLSSSSSSTSSSTSSPTAGEDDECEGDASSSYKELCEAKERLFSIFEEYVDDHKEAAIRTGIIEAAEYGALLAEDDYDARHVEANGRCWYLTAVVEGFGGPSALELPVPVLAGEDQYQIGVRFMWESFTESERAAFHDPKYFGVSGFRKNPTLKKELEKGIYRTVEKATRYSKMHGLVYDYFRKDREQDDFGSVRRQIRNWAKTVKEGFIFYFTNQFFVRRCFETLNSESRPEYAGFRAMCIRVFKFFPRCPPEGSISRFADTEDAVDEIPLSVEERFNEFCYRDEYCSELDLENVSEFLTWLGFLGDRSFCQNLKECEKLEELSRRDLETKEASFRQEVQHFHQKMMALEEKRNAYVTAEKTERKNIEVSALCQLDLLGSTEKTSRLALRPGGPPPRSLRALLAKQ